MKSTVIQLITLAVVSVAAISAITFVVSKTKKVVAVRVEDGMLEVETSSDGRLANPYSEFTYTPVGPVIALSIAIVLGLIAFLLAIFWAVSVVVRVPSGPYNQEQREPEN